MSKTWKMPTREVKNKAIKMVKSALKAGNSITKARQVAAKETGYTPSTIYNWEKENRTKRNSTRKTLNPTHSRFITSVNVKSTTGAVVKLTADDIKNIAKLAGHIH